VIWVAQRFVAAITTCHSGGLEPREYSVCPPTLSGSLKLFQLPPITSSYGEPDQQRKPTPSQRSREPAAAPKAQPQQSTKLPSDTVSLKSTGDVDREGDSH